MHQLHYYNNNILWGKNRDEKVSYAQIKREMYEKYYRNGVKLDELKIRLEEENLNWTSVEDITDKQAEKFASSLGYEKDSTGLQKIYQL